MKLELVKVLRYIGGAINKIGYGRILAHLYSLFQYLTLLSPPTRIPAVERYPRRTAISSRPMDMVDITRALLILNSGIILGTIFSNTIDQNLIGAVLSMVGAPNIEFIINPFHAYILSPIALMIIVTITTLLSIVSMKDFNISDMTAE